MIDFKYLYQGICGVANAHPLIAVLFADLEGDIAQDLRPSISAMAQVGFLGVMIDTFDKRAGSLRDHWA